MAANSLIVTVLITKQTRVVSVEAFNVPIIFGPSNRLGGNPYAVYNSYAQMIAPLGPFMASDPEAIEAQSLMGQGASGVGVPSEFVVAPNSPSVAEIDTFAVNALVAAHAYHFTLNSVVISYTSNGGDTQQSILAALLTAIDAAFPVNPPVTGAVTGMGGGALLTLTSTVPGIGMSYSAVDADLTLANVTPNHSIVTDIAAAQAAVTQDAQFYGVIVCSHVASDILQVAKYIETQLLVYVTASLDAGCLTNVTTDIMSELKSLTLDRTMILYSAQANTNGPDGAWMGYMLPTTPGTGNWADKTLALVDPDMLNPTQIANVLSKNGNVYVIVGGNGCTLYGKAAGGEYFDVTIFLDWLSSTIQTNIIGLITDPANLKIPYTNPGIALIENQVASALQQGQNNNGLAPGWSVFGPNVNSVPAADKQNRVLNGVGFNATLAGAINTVNIQGYVSA